MANDKLIYAHVNFYDPPTSAVTEATPDPEESVVTVAMVVRCKDCANSEDSHLKERIWCGKICRYMPGDGYCSMGVNR